MAAWTARWTDVDGWTSPFLSHHVRQKASTHGEHVRPLLFVYAHLMYRWCGYYRSPGELLLLPSLHRESEWTFIRNGSCFARGTPC